MKEADFYKKCDEAVSSNNKFKCPRHRYLSPRCEKGLYQQNCYKKFVSKESAKKERHDKKSEKENKLYEDLAKAVWKRDTNLDIAISFKGWNLVEDWRSYCRYYKSLSKEDQGKFETIIKNVDPRLLNEMTMAHRVSKGSNQSLKYEVDNVFLTSLYAHRMIDDGRDPITQKFITKEERLEIWKKIANE